MNNISPDLMLLSRRLLGSSALAGGALQALALAAGLVAAPQPAHAVICINSGAGTSPAGVDNNFANATACGASANARAANATALGSGSIANAAATAVGAGALANGSSVSVIGAGASSLVNGNNLAMGAGVRLGDNSAGTVFGSWTAVGAGANGSGRVSTSSSLFGANARISRSATSLAMGAGATVTPPGDTSALVAVGARAIAGARGGYSNGALGAGANVGSGVAIGSNAYTDMFYNSFGAAAIGDSARASFIASVAIGRNANGAPYAASSQVAYSTLALGADTVSGSNNSLALGAGARALDGSGSVSTRPVYAIGAGAAASNLDALALGAGATTQYDSQFVFGTASNSYRFAGLYSGGNLQTGATWTLTTDATGQLYYDANPDAGCSTATVLGANAIACGSGAVANGLNAAAWGAGANATGDAATATGSTSRALANRATAYGANALANAESAVALGRNAQALGAASLAAGAEAVASVLNATAFGSRASAVGSGALAAGADAQASAENAVALGSGAVASGVGSLALGAGAVASGARSVALGAGATATRDDQMALGGASTTLVAPGLTSAASRAAQQGPTKYVTVDAAGRLAATLENGGAGPAMLDDISAQGRFLGASAAGLWRQLADLQTATRRGYEGSAVAIATSGAPGLSEGKNYSLYVKWGTFRGENAVGATAQFRLAESAIFTASLGGGVRRGGLGGGLGLFYVW